MQLRDREPRVRKNVLMVDPNISEDDLTSAVNQSWNELAPSTRAKFETTAARLRREANLKELLGLEESDEESDEELDPEEAQPSSSTSAILIEEDDLEEAQPTP